MHKKCLTCILGLSVQYALRSALASASAMTGERTRSFCARFIKITPDEKTQKMLKKIAYSTDYILICALKASELHKNNTSIFCFFFLIF
jgi:hypothetical protein